MMTAVIAIASLAILFVVFGLLKPGGGCNGDCEGCTQSCEFTKDGYNG